MKKEYIHTGKIDFTQTFYPVNKHQQFLFDVYRFKVYQYFPATEFNEYVQYYLIQSQEEIECAVLALNWFRESPHSKCLYYQTKFLIKAGDDELFGYLRNIVLDKLFKVEIEKIKRLDLTIYDS